MENSSKPNKKAKYIGIIVAVLAAIGSYYVINKTFSAPAFEKQLVEAANKLNKKCPQIIDEETRLDNSEALPGNIFQYNYTYFKYTKEDFNIDTLRSNLEPLIIQTVRTMPQLKIFRDNKVIMSYNYKDKNGVFLLKIDVGPDKYSSK